MPSQGWTGLTLRLFDVETGRWSLNWSSSRSGRLFPPVLGRFGPDGRGEFHGDDTHDGKDVRVRFVWSGISETTARWEQAFSVDGENTWLTNWTMDFTRRKPSDPGPWPGPVRFGSHEFSSCEGPRASSGTRASTAAAAAARGSPPRVAS